MQYSVLETPASVEPLTTAEAKAHLRVDASDEDTLIDALISTARQRAEVITRRQLITATWKLILDSFPGQDRINLEVLTAKSGLIYVPHPPLQSVASVKYIDTTGSQQTLDAAKYQVDSNSEPARILPAVNEVWPLTQLGRMAAVEILFDAGYGDAGSDVPEGIKQAMKLMIGHWYEHREDVIVGPAAKQVPVAANALLAHFTIPEI